ncbi:MAG: tetratricopeptide repeat protein [Lachnospiraceae bacterium]|nr:tetratricopeptide repeat protein [Lachnospiraceae bacterium]
MRCYKCNSVLLDMDFCNSCGTNVVIYKKIVKLSNSYYNMGLAKARVRDLSGAADLLQRSIKIDKNNINARNLLGLVYYEMGESAQALKEWVLSKNISPEKNLADDYIKEVQSNPNKHEAMSQSIKKFNIALGYAKDGSDDLAIIQLKKLLSLNHHFVKGHLLLALMYMKKEEYDRAKKELNRTLSIDKCNTLALKYLKEIEYEELKKTEASRKKKKTIEDLKERDALSGNDVIIPENAYKEVNYGLRIFGNILIGILIGAASVYFLVTPARVNQATNENASELKGKYEEISKLNVEIQSITESLETLTKERDDLKAQLGESTKSEETLASYDILFQAANKYMLDDKIGCADMLFTIKNTEGVSASYTALQTTLQNLTYPVAGKHYYNNGVKAWNNGDADTAISMLSKVEVFDPTNTYAIYCLGRSYLLKNNDVNNEDSKRCFNKVMEMEPDSDYAEWAAIHIKH